VARSREPGKRSERLGTREWMRYQSFARLLAGILSRIGLTRLRIPQADDSTVG
jgi:hypothetical protein